MNRSTSSTKTEMQRIEMSASMPKQLPAKNSHGWTQSFQLLQVLSMNEVRLRMRRLSTMIAVMAVIAISWVMIVDPKTGSSMMVISASAAHVAPLLFVIRTLPASKFTAN